MHVDKRARLLTCDSCKTKRFNAIHLLGLSGKGFQNKKKNHICLKIKSN